MPAAPPIALILFSNDLDDFLPSVEQERKLIEEALEHYSDTNRLKVIARSSVSIEEIFRLFNRYQGRIALFHFAGHAGGEGLQLNQDFSESVTGHAGGLADLFKREVEDGELQLVFLNGCSTKPQLEGLIAAGVPSVISTKFPIEDAKALHFANQFYRTLASSDQTDPFQKPASVEQAFDQALAYLKTIGAAGKNQTRAGRQQASGDAQTKEEPWTWHSTNGTWTLSAEVAEEGKVFNEYLTRKLVEAIPTYSKYAKRFIHTVKDTPDWESNGRMSGEAKKILTYSFVGVLGIQLRKLFAIGKDPNSMDKYQRYISNGILTSKRALELLNFSLLSSLWDHLKQYKVELNREQREVLQSFFDHEFGFTVTEHFTLLIQLIQLFKDNKKELPISELESVLPQLNEESDLAKACERLSELTRNLDKGQFELSDCFIAERQLTFILETLAFLAQYRMVSIKNVTYKEMRNAPPRYLHSFTVLGIGRKQHEINAERVNFVDAPISTQSILLFKGRRYQQSINLFPFLIDLNSLTDETGAKVCFYSHQSLDDGSLNYQIMEDNAIENIAYHQTLKDEAELNQLMMDDDLRHAHNLDSVFLQFQEAKKVLLQSEGDLEDSDFLADDEDDFDF